jgi:hypothetical protein
MKHHIKFFPQLILAIFALMLSAHVFSQQGNISDTVDNQSRKYFRHLMFRETPYAEYRGIHPVEVDKNPNFAHYEFSLDSQGRTTQIRYQINDNLIRGNEVWDSFIWFAPVVKVSYSPGKEVHTYFNAKDQQIEAHGSVYRAEYQLDGNGQRTALSFFDMQGDRSHSAWNIHRYEWRHEGELVYEKRFDVNNQQQTMRPELEFHEISLEYDADDKLAFMRNLGLDGVPTNNKSGAGIDRVTYDLDGNFIRWQVYDKDGNAVEGNRPMVHLGEHLYDNYGNKVGLRGFDRSGKQVPFSWGVFEHASRYNKYGNQIESTLLKQDGSAIRRLAFEYTAEQNKKTWLKSINANQQLVSTPMLGGAAALKFTYNQEGDVQRQRFNPELTEFVPPAAIQSSDNSE